MTLRYVYDQDQEVARFVAALIPHVGYRGFTFPKTIGVVDEHGRLIAGLVYERWNALAGTIEASAAALPGVKWVSRETVRRGFGYAFEAHGCQMLRMYVLASDLRTLRQLAACGFTFQTEKRRYGRDHDGVVCTLTAEDWAANPLSRPAPAPALYAPIQRKAA